MSFSNQFDAIPRNIAKYGVAIKRLAFARIIMLFIGIIVINELLPLMEQIPADMTDQDALMETLEPIAGQIVLYGFLSFIGLLISFVFYIRYLIKLNDLSKITSDINLRNVFRLELTTIFINILVFLFVTNFIFLIILSMVLNAIGIISVVFLEKWVQILPSQAEHPPLRDATKSVFLMMKIGLIYSLVLEIISYFVTISGIFGIILLNLGNFLFIFAFWRLGKAIAISYPLQPLFSQPSMTYGQPQFSSYGTPPSQQNYGQEQPLMRNSPTNMTSTNVVDPSRISGLGGSEDHCSFCGAPKIDKNATFCSTCGQKYV
ncbi:zinc ribbon domain-containing protein [Candidatus Lokiarchaeum ossiferum]|uniref:zinc ribbon domain-containing protein n=1 Tax=Candidatus Lokiarchaeum ossiferum TaxID=2951803 RepID=UPI00352F7EEF